MVTLSQENEIKMIVDVLQSLHQPTHVIANLCWKPGKGNFCFVFNIHDMTPLLYERKSYLRLAILFL